MFWALKRTIRTVLFLSTLFIFLGCSGMERTEREKIRQRNCKGEYIYRSQSDFFFPIAPPQLALRASYPWETEGNLPRITKDFFRCKGSSLNPFMIDKGDCEGGSQHGLSVLNGKEGVVSLLMQYYQETPCYQGQKDYLTFQRYEKPDAQVKIQPWFNKEVYIK